MRKIIVITQLTLDGVMQGPGGPKEDPSNGFAHGGWAMPFNDEEGSKAIDEVIAGDFDLLLGRRTYDIWIGYWPHHADTSIGEAFNKATKYVVTSRAGGLDWKTTKRISGDVVAEIRRLKESDGPPLHIWGSSQLLQTLIAADLIDEYRLWVFPVVLGEGKRLFDNGLPPRRLTLVETRRTPSGVLLDTYRPSGPLPPAS